MKKLFLTLLLLAAGLTLQATVKTVTYNIFSWDTINNTVEVAFERSGDSPFDPEAAEIFTAYFNNGSLNSNGDKAGSFSVALADGFNLNVYWSAGSKVQITNNCILPLASGANINYRVSCNQEYYVTHVTMKDANKNGGNSTIYDTTTHSPVDEDFDGICGFSRTYKSYGWFGKLIVTYSDVPTKLDLTLNEVDGRYWGSYYGSANYRLPEGAAAYTMNEQHNLYRVGTDGRIIPANTAVVVLSDKKDITLNYTTDNASIHGKNILKGSVNPVNLNAYGQVGDGIPYVLGVKNGTLGLYKYKGDQIPAGKAYYANGNEVYLNTLTGSSFTATNGQTLIGTLSRGVIIYIEKGATVTLQDVSISASSVSPGITCKGNATIILSGTNEVKASKAGHSGLQPGPAGTTLTIRGTGSLTATGEAGGAGIGSGRDATCGNIRIESGTIRATGGMGGAGIGSGSSTIESANNNEHERTSVGDITIVGGDITAIGGKNTGGIVLVYVGGGGGNTNSPIKYYGSPGIGSGAVGTCGNISIGGATVTATGWVAAGIGSGGGGVHSSGVYDGVSYLKNSVCGDISIYGSSTHVTANSIGLTVDAIGRTDGDRSTCGAVRLDGTMYWTGSEYLNNGENILTQIPLVYPLTN